MVGTTMAWVMCSSAASCTQAVASKAGRYMMRRPAYRELKTAAMPAMWYEGTQISWASVGSQPRNSTLEMM